MGISCMSQGTQTGALYQTKGVGWGGEWEGGSRGRGYMYTYGCNGTPLQYSCLENPMDGGRWWAAVWWARYESDTTE